MNWGKLFAKQILERGYDYYRSGNVEIRRCSDELAEAVVSGSYDYEVDIYFDNGEIEDMYCDCPYADDGSNCKHMAAVLYALDNGDIKAHERTDVDGLINDAPAETFREFLLKIMPHDDELKDKFVRFLRIKSQSINEKEYISHLEMLVLQYSDRGYICWNKTSNFMSEAVELLNECTDKLIEEKRFCDAFEITRYYYAKVMTTDMDDDGDKYYFYEVCLEILQNIADSSDPDTRRRIFESSLKMLSPKFDDVFGLFLKFIRSSFGEKEYLRRMLEYSDNVLAKSIPEYKKNEWVMYRIELMDKLNCSDDELMEFCHDHWDNAEVRRYMTDRFVSNGSTEKAIQILEESLKLYKNDSYSVRNIHIRLKDIYKQADDKSKYIKELWELLTKHNMTDTDIYLEFKSLFDADEWEDIREKLYSSMKHQSILPEYFIEEKLTDRLASYVFTNKTVYLVEKYESYLAEDYTDNILVVYENELNEAAKNTADRSTYRRWADKLRHMKKLRGGKECVRDIIENWQTLYRNRPAMMQEIGDVLNEG